MTVPYPYVQQPPNPFGIDFWIGLAPGPVGFLGSSRQLLLDGDPSLRTVTGRAILVQSLLCRQSTPRGSVIDCPNDCLDLRDYVAEGMTPTQVLSIYGTIQAELLKDQRVSQAIVNGSYSFQTSVLTLNEAITSSYGPFTLVLAVSAVTVQLLNANLLAGS
jgi:hypothetical protein